MNINRHKPCFLRNSTNLRFQQRGACFKPYKLRFSL
ncbi:hypothetical protein T02_510 [Trichinella nativa]|uniref:Uncharacterized protein n=1 Tax=Trichinella nativa TaxID=6335 RepID=A0A0V1J3T1_9BILA|nr:hypothetical protein T02_510 [Trichinella nativa]